jgi:hypothetical protein
MNREIDIKEIDSRIKIIKSATEELKKMSDSFPALKSNTTRILAGVKMLEINISDLIDL